MTTTLTPEGLEALRARAEEGRKRGLSDMETNRQCHDVLSLISEVKRLQFYEALAETTKEHEQTLNLLAPNDTCAAERDRLSEDLRAAKAENEKLAAVVGASRAIRSKYPGGKMLWFSEFDAFEKALAALDQQSPADEGET